jgi:hypothetical protein
MVTKTGFRIHPPIGMAEGFGRLLSNMIPALPLCCLLVAGIINAQMPANTPIFSANAKWVTDRGSQVYNVRAYGAKCDGSTDDGAAFAATLAAIPAGGGTFFIPPSATPCVLSSAQLAITARHVLVSGYGAILSCNLSTDCVMIGSPTNANLTGGVSIYGLHMLPTANSAGYSAFRDNAQGTHFVDVGGTGTNWPLTFGHFIENDNDQSQVIDHLYDVGGMVGCTAASCGSALWGNGSGGNSGITWIHDSNLSMGCSGNSIDWDGNNHLTVSRSIIQAFSQFGLRTYADVDIDGWTHWEQGACTNPLNDGNGHALGGAGLIAIGAAVTAEGSAPGGVSGTVFSTNSAGSAVYWYYVVGHTSSGATTAPLIAGALSNGPATISGSAEVFAVWPALTASGITTFDLLRTAQTIPYGTGNYAVATGLSASSVCGSNGVCSYTDTVGTPASYTVASENWYPSDPFWPGNLVLFEAGTSGGDNGFYVARYSGYGEGNGLVVDSAPSDTGMVHLAYQAGGYLAYSGSSTPLGPAQAYQPGNTIYGGPSALVLPADNSGGIGPTINGNKGIVNLGSAFGFARGTPGDLQTLNDSNPAKTRASLINRPTYDAADTAICRDDGLSQQLCFRAPTSISNYINHLPDGSSWLERLTASLKIFTVPVQAPNFQLQSPVAVASLPACATGTLGIRQLVNNATVATPGNPAVGGGTYTIAVECIYNSTGSAYGWIID